MYYPNMPQQPFNKNTYSAVNQPMEMVKPTYDQFVIKPPERNKTHGRISQKLVVDSRDRDHINYPKPNKYKYEIKEEYKDVISVELVLAGIPNSVYNIYEKNNEIILNSGNSVDSLNNCKKFKIHQGEYTNQSFLDLLNGSKGNIFQTFANGDDPAYFNFYEDPDTNLIKIQSNKPFSFNLDYDVGDKFIKCNQGDIDKYYESINYNSLDKTLGFKRKKYTAATKYSGDVGSTCDNDLPTDVTLTPAGGVAPPVTTVSENGYTLWRVTIVETGTMEDYDVRKFYSKGDYIEIGSELYRVYETLNKATMDVEQIDATGGAPSGDAVIARYYAIYGSYAFELECPQYVILDIPQFHMLKADPASIDDAYAVIELDGNSCKTIVNSGGAPLDKDIKYFNPPLARLKSIDVKFLRYDGSLVDFKGVDHLLAFRVTCLNQPGKYNNFNENTF